MNNNNQKGRAMQTTAHRATPGIRQGRAEHNKAPGQWLNTMRSGLVLTLGLILTLGMQTAQAALTVTLTAPANNTAALAPASFTLNASASNPNGPPIKSVAFYANNTLLGTVAAPTGTGAITLPAQAAQAPIATSSTITYTWNWTNVPMGRYTVTAVVTDMRGATATSSPVTVVSDVPPTVNIAAPANNTVITAPATFTLTANASAPLGSIARVEFYATRTNNGGTTSTLIGTATTGTNGAYTITWPNIPWGTYSITAKATDNWGFSNTSSPLTVISNQPPTVSLTGPAANTVSVAPGSFTISAAAADIDGTIAKVDFYASNGQNNTLIGTATTGTNGAYTWNWTNVPVGKYTLTAVATDNYGAATTSGPLPVISDAPPRISITGPQNNSVSIAPASFTINTTATSQIGTIAKVDFYANNGQTNTLIGTVTAGTNGAYTYTWNNIPGGAYTLTAIATDNYGITGTSAPVNVVSDIPPAIGITSPRNNTTATAPANLAITANASSTTATVARVDFYASNGQTNTLIGTATGSNNTYSYTWNNIPAGAYTLTAIATDSYNITNTSSPVSITIKPGDVQAYYIHTDHLDTPREITDTNGNIVWQWDNQDPFGNNAPNENPSNQGQFSFNLRFPGQ